MGQMFSPARHFALPSDALAAAETMAEKIMAFCPATDSDALKLLRAGFPNSPLSLRVAALGFLARRKRTAPRYRPR